MEKVAKEKAAKDDNQLNIEKGSPKPNVPAPSPSTNVQLKGVSESLLERVCI